MITAAMYFALGLLTAGILALAIMPAVWRRAARLTRARVEESLPLTLAEIEADKDQLRANFAVANRKLELDVETLRTRLAEDAVERGRSRDEVTALTRARAALSDTVAGLEERVAELTGALITTENKVATATAEIAARDRGMADLEDRIADLKAQLSATQVLTEEQRVEMVARNTEIANLANRAAAAAATETAATNARDKLAAELSMERDRLYSEQKRADGLAAGLAALEAERIARLAELERTGNDKRALEAGLVAERERARALAAELEHLRAGRPADRDDEASKLRERLREIAASVVRISQAMDAKPPLPADVVASRSPDLTPANGDPPDADHPLTVAGTRH